MTLPGVPAAKKPGGGGGGTLAINWLYAPYDSHALMLEQGDSIGPPNVALAQ